jgi:hypothetical protein
MRADDMRISKARGWSKLCLGLGLGISLGILVSGALLVASALAFCAGFAWRYFEGRAQEIEGKRDHWIAEQLEKAKHRDALRSIGGRS